MEQIEETVSRFEEFLEGLRTKVTRVNYSWGIKYVLGDPDAFLLLAVSVREKAEERLVEFIKKERGRAAPSTPVNPFAGIKSFLDFYEVDLNWRKIRQVLPSKQESRQIRLEKLPVCRELDQASWFPLGGNNRMPRDVGLYRHTFKRNNSSR